MPAVVNTQTGQLISNAHPYVDGSIQVPFVTTIAAAGTTQATATPVVGEVNLISNNTAANGVILTVPNTLGSGNIGQRVVIYPQLATNAPLVYPPLGGTINNGAVNAGFASAARVARTFICVSNDGLTWISN